MLSEDLTLLTARLMLVRERKEAIDLAGKFGEVIGKIIEAEKAGREIPAGKEKSISTALKFSEEEVSKAKMDKGFRKEFILNGLVARVTKRPSGKNSVCYEIRYRSNGYNISVSSTDLKKAKAKFIKATMPGEIEKHRTEGRSSGMYYLDEIAAEWLKYKRGKIAEKTWKGYESMYRRYISPVIGRKPVPLIKALDIGGVLDERPERLYEDLRTLFSQIFKYALNIGIIDRSPMLLIPFKRAERSCREALTETQVRTLLAALERPEFAAYRQPFLIMLYFGLRPCELADAHFAGDFLIARNAKRKNGKIEYKKIPVSDMIRDKIDFNSVTKPGMTSSMNRVFKKIMGDGITQYSLRHTFATVCQQYVRPDIVDIWMGDSPERLVGRVYTHFPDDFMRKQMNSVIFTV